MRGETILNAVLTPLSLLYGLGVMLRNRLFDWGVLKSRSYSVPVISVGNLAVGGTGKTPHTEYLVELLRHDFRVAVLSRGYKRKTKGFILASGGDDAATIGDEPWQMKKKFADILLAVDANRRRGIANLLALPYPPDVIILDDAYQHRYVKPGISILLTDYDRVFAHDYLLPAGRLREPAFEKQRANVIIVTKCPEDISPIDYRIRLNDINPYPYQSVFFTKFEYLDLVGITHEGARLPLGSLSQSDSVLVLTGIAHPKKMVDKIAQHAGRVKSMAFPDHHDYSDADMERVARVVEQMGGSRKLVVTTEKDAARLETKIGKLREMDAEVYYLPIKVRFLRNKQEKFNNIIRQYVEKNRRNGELSEGSHDHEA